MGKLNNIRQVLAAGIIVTIVMLAVTLYLKLPELRKKVPKVSRLPRNIDISLSTVTYSETREGRKKWVLEAQQADVAQKNNLIYLTRPHFVVYLDQQPGTVTMTAGRAVYDIKTRDVTLADKVSATSDSGMYLETEKMFFDAGRSLLTADHHVKLVHRNATVEGDGMELHTVKGTVKLLQERLRHAYAGEAVTVAGRAIWVICFLLLKGLAFGAPSVPSLPERSDNPIYIKSDQLLTDTKNRTATFSGKVTARQGDLALYADRMVVYYAAEGGDVERVECSGKIRIVQKNRVGTAGKAVYDNKQGKIVLTENPKVFQGEDMISGSEITYFLADQRSIVTGAPNIRVEAVIHPKGKQDPRAPR